MKHSLSSSWLLDRSQLVRSGTPFNQTNSNHIFQRLGHSINKSWITNRESRSMYNTKQRFHIRLYILFSSSCALVIDYVCSVGDCACVDVIRLVTCWVVDMLSHEKSKRCDLEICSNRKFKKTRKSQGWAWWPRWLFPEFPIFPFSISTNVPSQLIRPFPFRG